MPLSTLFRWDGYITRRTYILVGLLGCAIKFLLDAAVSALFFHRQLHFVDYWQPLGAAARLQHLTLPEIYWLSVLLLTALPFINIGLAMTVRRLRDSGRPLWLAILFFVPFADVPFFLILSCLPSVPHLPSAHDSLHSAPRRTFTLGLPRSEPASAAIAVLFSAEFGVATTFLLTKSIGSYGWSLFLALPYCMGLFSVLLYSLRQQRSPSHCMMVALLPVVLIGIVLLAIAIEGAICLLMAAPIALALAVFGGWTGYILQQARWMLHPGNAVTKSSLCLALLLLPLSAALEHTAHLAPPLYQVQSSIAIDAPPAAVWQKVIAFSQIPPPTEALFRAGIAYPIRAEITGRGPGALRRCEFSTGPFVEPIEVWDEPHLLRFNVTENPAPLNEISPYGSIRPPHLHGYFVSRRGQFLLTELPGGRTLLTGTTWYTDAVWPSQYWCLWSDYIIHRIHLRVLTHIKHESEQR
jgi:uncharacterized membrane protein YhaH (DUF805 family)